MICSACEIEQSFSALETFSSGIDGVCVKNDGMEFLMTTTENNEKQMMKERNNKLSFSARDRDEGENRMLEIGSVRKEKDLESADFLQSSRRWTSEMKK